MNTLAKTLGALTLALIATGCDSSAAKESPSEAPAASANTAAAATEKTASAGMAAKAPAADGAKAATPAPAPQAMATSLTTTLDPTKTKARGKAPLSTQRGFPMHTAATAPEATDAAIQFGVSNFGFVSNLTAVMAESPALLNSYYILQRNLQSVGSLTPPEDNIVQMSIAMENECQYCVAGHTLAGKVFFKSADEELEAIRAEAKLPEPKFNALRDFGLQVYESKGRVTDAQLETFLAAGYTRQQALDVVANVAAKVMSNYANQLAQTPLDEQIKPLAADLPFKEDRKAVVN
ncbi:MAG: carboxymuconolactone decarboxylase family protein [Nannocystales bacterium]